MECTHNWSISILTEIFSGLAQHCARLCNCRKLTSWQPNQLCIESDKFTFSSLATQAAFILGKFVHFYKAYLNFLNFSEQYLFRDTSCTKRFNFRKSLKKPQKVSNLARKMWFCLWLGISRLIILISELWDVLTCLNISLLSYISFYSIFGFLIGTCPMGIIHDTDISCMQLHMKTLYLPYMIRIW